MSVNFLRNCSVAALTVFSAQSALADVTSQDVWGDWKAYLEGVGYSLEATETQNGDTLSISDFTLVIPIPEKDESVTVKMPNLELVENGDGSVNASFPQSATIAFDVSDAHGVFKLRSDGSPMVVTGDQDDMTYDYDTDLLEVLFDSLTVDGEDIPSDIFTFLMKFTDLKSTTHMKLGELRSYEQSYDIANTVYEFAFKNPEDTDSAGVMKGNLNDLKFVGTSTLPLEFDATDMNAMIDAGTAFDGTFSFGSGQSESSFNEGSENFQLNSTSQGGSMAFAMNADELKYDLAQKVSEISVVSSEIPFPIAFSAEEIGMKLQMPPTASEEDKDMSVGITLRDFNVPEALWAIVDPTGILPHDPASVVLDLSGKGRMLIDIFDPEATAQAEIIGETPALVNSVNVNELLLRAAGAELTGTGAFEIDYNDLESFDGMPAPLGVANLSLVGANTLIDNLIKMGIMSDSDATGARLMISLLTVPSDKDDTLTSEIEFGKGGQISANGQRLK